MKPKEAFEAVQTIIGSIPDNERSEFFELFGTAYRLGYLAVEASSLNDEETLFLEEMLLTGEQLERTEVLRDAISESWEIDKKYLRLITEGTPIGTSKLVLTDTSPSGQYRGSHRTIYKEGINLLRVGRKNIDILSGMTDALYRSMTGCAEVGNEVLPDSRQFSSSGERLRTRTMLTGESLTAYNDVLVRYNFANKVFGEVVPRDSDDYSTRVRPAVVIAEF